MQTRYVLRVHAGVVLTYPLDDEAAENNMENYAKLSKKALFAIICKSLDAAKESIETNRFDLLKKLESNLTDITTLGRFQMIESNEK